MWAWLHATVLQGSLQQDAGMTVQIQTIAKALPRTGFLKVSELQVGH